MKTREKKYTIPRLLEERNQSPEAAFAALSKHLKAATGSYQNKETFFTEILDRNEKNGTMISELKTTQWRVVNNCILLYAAITGAVQLARPVLTSSCVRTITDMIAAVCFVFVYVVARKMMDKIERDFSFYRAHRKLNEEILNITTGIQMLSNEVISSRRPDLRTRHDIPSAATENYQTFTVWLYVIISLAGLVALGIVQIIVWDA